MSDSLDARQRIIDQLNANRPKEPASQDERRKLSESSTFLDHTLVAFRSLTTHTEEEVRAARQDAKIKSRAKTESVSVSDDGPWRSAEEKRYFLSLEAEYDAVIALL